jgi:phosphoserine phosphatase RsbU/P
LFMAVSRTLLRATALAGATPAECLCRANHVLGAQGEPAVYVTVFYGILHTDSGELEFAIGGHNPPFRISESGAVESIEEPAGMVVGLLPWATYETGKLQLERDDSVFLFTDGVSEAMNAEERFFGERRLKETLSRAAGLAPREMVETVLSAVNEFTGDAPPSDDITLLAVKWTG